MDKSELPKKVWSHRSPKRDDQKIWVMRDRGLTMKQIAQHMDITVSMVQRALKARPRR